MSASNKGLPSNLQDINDRLVLKHAQLQEDRKSFLEFNAMASNESDPTKASLLSDTAKKLRLAFNEAIKQYKKDKGKNDYSLLFYLKLD